MPRLGKRVENILLLLLVSRLKKKELIVTAYVVVSRVHVYTCASKYKVGCLAKKASTKRKVLVET